MFFFFFFEELYNIPEINYAFTQICLDKMLIDGYFDMSIYLKGKIKKDEIKNQLIHINSKYKKLYEAAYPKREDATNFWHNCFYDAQQYSEINETTNLSYIEAKAIVNWVYCILDKKQERIEFTKQLFAGIKELNDIDNRIVESRGVFYNERKVEVHFISSLPAFNKYLMDIRKDNKDLFYRGHSNANYYLQPSIMRNSSWERHECDMYNELIIECPESFEKCNTHLEKLVEMQHYGLPTRLLDITRNPLVALYFACLSNQESFGEVILISSKKKKIKYPQSDSATVISSLALFDKDIQDRIKDLALTTSSDEEFNDNVPRLLHEIRLEKPAFLPEIKREDICDSFIVYAIKSNRRIIKQDGAFILCGLIDEKDLLNEYRFKTNGKKVILLIDNKKDILDELDLLSINNAALFPEIDNVTDYIKKKYQ